MEQAHVLGGLGAVGDSVAGKRPVDGEVEPIADPVQRTQPEHDPLLRGIEGDEVQGNGDLHHARRVDEALAPVAV